MKFRPLEADDAAAVHRIARRSLSASYGDVLDEETIDAAVDEWYGSSAVADYLDSDEVEFVVASDHGEVVGFSQSHVPESADRGRIQWIHVEPDHRGRRIGADLLERTRDRLRTRGVGQVEALVLAAHGRGVAFYEANGFEPSFERTVSIAGKEHGERVYVESRAAERGLEVRQTDAGEVYVDPADSTRGSAAPFHAAYVGPDRSERYSWFCTNCESPATAMDTMGKVQCSGCGNTRKPTRWDASYL